MRAAALIVFIALVSGCSSPEPPSNAAARVGDGLPDIESLIDELYEIGEYDPDADPAEDLQRVVARAQAENKRILVEIGGEWCSWCHILDAYIHDNPAIAAALAETFVVMKVNWSPENYNEEFLAGYPEVNAYPHFFVLESDGTFLHSQGTAVLEEGQSYRDEAILDFVDDWSL